MRKTLPFALVMCIALCPVADAQGGVVIRPSGVCSPTVPGELMVLYSTMNHFVTVYVTKIADGTTKDLTFEMRPNSQQELGCSVHGLSQLSWVIKSVKQPAPLPARR